MGTWAAGPDRQPSIQSPLPAMHTAPGQQHFSRGDTVVAGLFSMILAWWHAYAATVNSRRSMQAETSLTVMGR